MRRSAWRTAAASQRPNAGRSNTLSRFGYLRTPLPHDATPPAQADAHACLLDALGVERAAIAGLSAGAPSSLQFAIRHPQRTSALFLLVPLAYRPDARPTDAAAAESRTSGLLGRFMLKHAVNSDFLYWRGRSSQMPAHKELLSEAKIHLLTAYVLSLSQPPTQK